MEICQGCGEKIDGVTWIKVSFSVETGVTRSWVMCQDCAGTVQDMVLCFMGEMSEPMCDDKPKFQVARCPAYVPGECEEHISQFEGVSKLQCESETTVAPAIGTVYQTTINGHKANVLIVEYPESEIDKIC